VHAGLVVALAIVAGTGLIQFMVFSPKAMLNLYYLPVVLAAYLLGLRKGVYSALVACALVFSMALADESRFAFGSPEAWMDWLELGTWAAFLVLTAFVVGSMYERQQAQVRDLKQAYRGTIEIMGQFIDSVDRHTENHSHRVADYCVEIARELGLSELEVEDVRVGAFLHDIGKVEISTDVLRKAAALTDDEMREMRRHVDTGEAMVQKLGGILRHVIPMVAFHHERWDGTGYKCLRGEDIPIGARIIAVADTYDAIVTDRPYRKGKSHEQALRVIVEERGKQFDPRIVDVFVRLYGQSAEAQGDDAMEQAA
jgi:putative nucleotidyltransferase with HDIG domain